MQDYHANLVYAIQLRCRRMGFVLAAAFHFAMVPFGVEVQAYVAMFTSIYTLRSCTFA